MQGESTQSEAVAGRLVSIAINNYNYGRFVGAAMDSALAQTYRPLEVIVVDDESTDDSWAVIRRYGDRIRAIRTTANGGQGSACNAGMALARGEFVLLLDADDLLDPVAVETCVSLFDEGVAKVQFALRLIDDQGQSLGRSVPNVMHEGDVRPIIRAFGHYAGPPASGNLYRRSAIAPYYPLVAADWLRAADTPPFLLSAYHGRVVNAPGTLGSYRQHQPLSVRPVGNVHSRFDQALREETTRTERALALLTRHDGIAVDGPFLPLPWSVRTRALSWRLEPAQHPFANDSALSLIALARASVLAWPGYGHIDRWAMRLWVAAVVSLPLPLVNWAARVSNSGRLRHWFSVLRSLGSSAPAQYAQVLEADSPPALRPAAPGDGESPVTPDGPLVSILILNYNYALFVAKAIDSALAQTYRPLEIIVVDNGSTDESWSCIEPYADRVQVVRHTPNAGPGEGYSVAFALGRGEWVLFLDADDTLDADAISRAVSLVRADVAHVQLPLRLIDAKGTELGGRVPYVCHSGDLVQLIRRFGHYAGPPSSGNLYRRSAIAPCYPLDPATWRLGADTAPFIASAFRGRVASADRAFGTYRVHLATDFSAGLGNYSMDYATAVQLDASLRDKALALVATHYGSVVDGPFLMMPTNIRRRALSWRLAREAHPFAADTAVSLWRQHREAIRAWPGYGRLDRIAMDLWLAAVLLLPRPLARRVARSNTSGRIRQCMGRWRPARDAGATAATPLA